MVSGEGRKEKRKGRSWKEGLRRKIVGNINRNTRGILTKGKGKDGEKFWLIQQEGKQGTLEMD